MTLGGFADETFAGVADRFAECFEVLPDRDRPEWGAAAAAFVDGECVVDLWAGFADAERAVPWTAETRTGIASCRKALSALGVHVLVDRGELGYDTPICQWWPEFAQHGKSAITLRHVLSHQAGLPALPPVDSLSDASDMANAIAAAAPQWAPGTAFGYSGTFDWIIQAVIERVVDTSFPEWFQRDVTDPFGLDISLNLTDEIESSVAPWIKGDGTEWPIPGWWPETAYATARSLAELFGVLATGGASAKGILLSPQVLNAALTVQISGTDCVSGHERAFRLGWRKSVGRFDVQVGTDGFGSPGGFGSVVWGDADKRLGFSFIRNLCTTPQHEYRANALLDAVGDALNR